LAGVTLVAGLHIHVDHLCRALPWTLYRAQAEQVLALHDRINSEATTMPNPEVHVFADMLADWMHPGALAVRAYESQGRTISYVFEVGGVFALTEVDALAAVKKSQIVLLSTGSQSAPNCYPFNRCMVELRPILREYCDRHMIKRASQRVSDTTVDVYVRPVCTGGTVDGWIETSGLTISADQRPVPRTLEARGKIDLQLLGKVPEARASITRDGCSGTAGASLRVVGDDYVLRLELPASERGPAPCSVTVEFDTYFVPRNLGKGADDRRLVLRVPDVIELDP
jgi:hypothetical protein